MRAPYDVEILPCVFFEAPQEKEKLLSSTSTALFRKRANTTDKLAEDLPSVKFNMTLGNI